MMAMIWDYMISGDLRTSLFKRWWNEPVTCHPPPIDLIHFCYRNCIAVLLETWYSNHSTMELCPSISRMYSFVRTCRFPSQYAKRWLIVRSCNASKKRVLCDWNYLMACWDVCQNSKRYEYLSHNIGISLARFFPWSNDEKSYVVSTSPLVAIRYGDEMLRTHTINYVASECMWRTVPHDAICMHSAFSQCHCVILLKLRDRYL